MSAETDSGGADAALHETHMGRRRYLQLVGAAAATAAVGSSVSTQPASAGIWDTATDAAKATGTGLYLMTPVGQGDYFLSDDYGIFQDDYQVAEAQMDAALRTAISMRDGDDRALAMAWNHLENARDVAWIEAQGAAMDPMQNGESEEDVIAAASDAAAEYLSGTVENNVLNHWNAQVTKIEDIRARVNEHSDISMGGSGAMYLEWEDSGSEKSGFHCGSTEHTLLNGETKSIKTLIQNALLTDIAPVGEITNENNYTDIDVVVQNSTTGATALWLDYEPSDPTTWADQTAEDNGLAWSDAQTLNKWMIILDRVQEIYDDVVANVEQWASEAYGSLQAGDVDMTDVISPTAMASEMSTRYDDTGHLAYAAAGLAALNLSVDYENMMTFQLSDGSTFKGTLFVDSEFEWEVGETINPSNVDGAIYAAVDSPTYERTLTSGDHYRTEIDGGEVVFYLEPIDQAVYEIATNNDETVSIEGSAWEQTNPDASPEIGEGETDWAVDLSDDLEQPIAEVSEMTVSFSDDVESDTITLNEPFQITDAYDVESGDSVSTVSGDGGTENYNTVDASELEDALSQHREYLEEAGAFESDDAPGGGGGGGGIDLGGDGGLLDFLTNEIMGIPVWMIILTGGGALLVASR